MEGIKTKGVIKCPCCRKGKIVAYEDAAGKGSLQNGCKYIKVVFAD